MQVLKDPPYGIPKNSYMYHWETKVRKYFTFFEKHKNGAHESLQRVHSNPFTRTQEFLRFLYRYKAPEVYELRQQLGDITKSEVASANKALGKTGSYHFRKARGEPAKVLAYRKNILWVALLSAGGVAYTMIYHRKGRLWWIAPFAPLILYAVYNRVRQPIESTANVYRFILAKRIATAQMAGQEKEMINMIKAYPKLSNLRGYLIGEKTTLYELQQNMINSIINDKF
eukprot:TRINITY_DN6898_c0_g2_i8.p1 TRINITY_DN6898_c0_g2~~TRINITY_DN6898_c0_g2_i8.p1  ORF type:complete len:228 (-),score=51.88 TRINITY_DN6898_c0_g2_i8:92-775(-)